MTNWGGEDHYEPPVQVLPLHACRQWQETILTVTQRSSQEHPGQPAAGSPQEPWQVREGTTITTSSLSLPSVGDGSERSSSYWCRNVNRSQDVVYNEKEVPEAGRAMGEVTGQKHCEIRGQSQWDQMTRESDGADQNSFIQQVRTVGYQTPGALPRTESTAGTQPSSASPSFHSSKKTDNKYVSPQSVRWQPVQEERTGSTRRVRATSLTRWHLRKDIGEERAKHTEIWRAGGKTLTEVDYERIGNKYKQTVLARSFMITGSKGDMKEVRNHERFLSWEKLQWF